VREKKNCSQRRANAKNPTAGNKIRCDWLYPENGREEKQNQ
jgi:hypothetical protein